MRFLVTPPRTFAIAGLLALLLCALGLYAWSVPQPAWEADVVRRLQDATLPGLRPISITLAVLGTGLPWAGVIGVLGLALFLLSGLRAAFLLLVTALLQDVGAALKLLIERSRPAADSVDVWHQVTSYSFPSGHTLGATLVFGFLVVALEHCGLSLRVRRSFQAICLAWILLMGLGRMELGAHWPTDVLGAYLVGALLLLPIVALLRRSRAATA